MKVDWELTPRMLFSQLSAAERAQVLDAISGLPERPEDHEVHPEIAELQQAVGSGRKLFVLKNGQFRIIFAREPDAVVVVDLFPTSQMDGLRAA